MRVLFAILLLLSLAACSKPPAAKRYELEGRVVAVDAGNHQLTIAHQDVAGLMKGMTMPFTVSKSSDWVFKAIAPAITFTRRVFLYEDYQRQQLKFLAEVFRFLGVDAGFVPDTSERHLGPRVPRSVRVGHFLKKYGVWQHASKLSSSRFRSFLKKVAIRPRGEVKVDPRDREFLQDYYRDDIRKLAGVLNRDLNSWLC